MTCIGDESQYTAAFIVYKNGVGVDTGAEVVLDNVSTQILEYHNDFKLLHASGILTKKRNKYKHRMKLSGKLPVRQQTRKY